MTIPSAKALLEDTNARPYGQRVSEAVRVGVTNRNNAALTKLIGELRKHPDAEVPEVETDDGFSELLPPQSTNVAPHYHQDMLALYAASASKTHLDVLKEELTSSSRFFKKFAVKEVVRQETNDQALVDLILRVVPNVRTKMIHACIRYKRTAVLDAAFPKLVDRLGVDYVAPWCHGLSSAVLTEALNSNSELLQSSALNWGKIAKFSMDVVANRMECEFKEKDSPFEHLDVWREWNSKGLTSEQNFSCGPTTADGKLDMSYKINQRPTAALLMELESRFPAYIYVGGAPPISGVDSDNHVHPDAVAEPSGIPFVSRLLPAIFTSSANMRFFNRVCSDSLFAHFESTLHLDHCERLRSSIPSVFFTKRSVSFEHTERFLRKVVAASSFNSIFERQAWSKRTDKAKEIPRYYLELRPSTPIEASSHYHQYVERLEEFFEEFGVVEELRNKGGGDWAVGLRELDEDVKSNEGTMPVDRVWDSPKLTTNYRGEKFFFVKLDSDAKASTKGIRFTVTRVWGSGLKSRYKNNAVIEQFLAQPHKSNSMDRWLLYEASFLNARPLAKTNGSWSPDQMATLVGIGFDLLEKSMPAVELDDNRTSDWLMLGRHYFAHVVAMFERVSLSKHHHKLKKGTSGFEVENKFWPVMRGACARYAAMLLRWRAGYMEKLVKFAKVLDRLKKLAEAISRNMNRQTQRLVTSKETTKIVYDFHQKLEPSLVRNQQEPLATVDELDDAVRELERLYEANHGDVRTHMNLNASVHVMTTRSKNCQNIFLYPGRSSFYQQTIGPIFAALLNTEGSASSEFPMTPQQAKEGLEDALALHASLRPAPPEDTTELEMWRASCVPGVKGMLQKWLRWRHPDKKKAKQAEIDCGPNSVKLREKNPYRECIKTALAGLSTFYLDKYLSQEVKDAEANRDGLQQTLNSIEQTLADESKGKHFSLFVSRIVYDNALAHEDIEPLRVIDDFNRKISELVLSSWNPLDVSVSRIAEEWASVRRAVFSAGVEPSERQFRQLQTCAEALRTRIRDLVTNAYEEADKRRSDFAQLISAAPHYSDDLKKLIGDHFTLLEDRRPTDPVLCLAVDRGSLQRWRNTVLQTFQYWREALSDYSWQHRQDEVGDVLELVISRSSKLIKEYFRTGLDERISVYEKLFKQFEAYRDEQVKLRKARQRKSVFEPEQDVVDIDLHDHMHALIKKLTNTEFLKAQAACAEFVSIARSKVRNTAQEVKTDLGTEFSNANVDKLQSVYKTLETLYMKAQERAFKYDRESLSALSSIPTTQISSDPRLWMRLFRELVPVFIDSQPRPFPADKTHSTVNAAKTNYLSQVCTLARRCLSQLTTYRDSAKKWEEEKEHDPKKQPPIPRKEVDAFIEETVQYFFDHFIRAFDVPEYAKFLRDLLNHAEGDVFARNFKQMKPKLTVDHLDTLKSLMLNKSNSTNEKERKGETDHSAEWALVFSSFRDIPDPLKHIPVLTKVMKSATPAQRLAIFKSFEHSHLNHLAQQAPQQLTEMLDALHREPTKVLEETRTLVSQWLVELVKKNAVSKVTKDLLLKYQDITVPAVRKDLERASDSNSVAQRNAALETLVAATLLCNEDARLVQGKRTLAFFRKRLKNETVENRADGLKILLEPRESITALVKTEYTEVWSDLLSDALQSSDLDQQPEDDYTMTYGGYHSDEANNPAGALPECWAKHRVLKHFFRVSKAAISYGTSDTKGTFFDFGVEVQWRISLFRLGLKKASERFRISFSSALLERGSQYELHPDRHFKEDEEEQFVEGWIEAYQKRISERNPDFLKHTISSFTYLEKLFDIIGKNAHKLPVLREHVRLLLERIKRQRDFILEDAEAAPPAEQQDVDMVDEFSLKPETDCEVSQAMSVFWTILKYNRKSWSDIGVFREYIDTLFVVARSAAPHPDDEEEKSDAYREICKETFTFFNELIRLFHHNQLPLKFGQKATDWWTDATLTDYARSFLGVIRNTPPREENAEFTALEKRAVQTFDKLMSDNGKEWHKVELCRQYVDTLAEVFSHAQIREKSMASMEQVAVRVLPNLVALATEGPKWHEIPSLVKLAEAVLSVLKNYPKKDHEGLLIVEGSCEPIACFEKLFKVNRNLAKKKFAAHWQHIPVLKEYVETMLRSRQALIVLFRWFYAETNFTKSRKARQQARNAVVEKLLSISKSAVYLKFVWSHLVRWRQDLLDEFLNSGECYHGVYYQVPDERSQKHKKKKEKDTEVIVPSRMSRFRSSRRVRAVRHHSEDSTTAVGIEDVQRVVDAQKLAEQEFDQEKLYWIQKREKEIQEMKTDDDDDVDPDVLEKRREDAAFDHEDMFCMPGCFGLHRLLPEQNQKLAKQRVAQVLNADRSRPERVKAAIRLTLIPSVTYPTVLAFMQRHEFSINVIEALLKGFLQNKDDILAPLHYLLSPEILSSDRSRVAIYSVSQCVPHMKPNVFSGLLKHILTGKRRNALKVTAYKEIIRLLITNPTRRHINMITHEWKRQVLHRDVRIAILQAAFKFLLRSREIRGAEDACWRIFESALDGDLRSNVEILSTLVGVTPVLSLDAKNSADSRFDVASPEDDDIVLQPRIVEHLETFAEVEIPTRHVERYTRDVVLKLCNRINMVTKEEPPKEKKKQPEKDGDGDAKMVDDEPAKKDTDGDAEMESVELVEKTHRDDDLAFLAFATLPRWLKAGYPLVEAMKLLYDVVVDDSEDFTNNTKSDVQTVNNTRWTFCARYFLAFAGLTATSEDPSKELLTWVSNAVTSLCESIKKTEVSDRDRRIVLISRLDLLLNAIEPYFNYVARAFGKDGTFFDALENNTDDMWWLYVMRYHSKTLYVHCDDQATFNAQASKLITRQIAALQDHPHYLHPVVENVNTILQRSFDYDPDYASNPVTPTIEFVRSFLERVVSEAGRTSDIGVLLRREIALSVFCVESKSSTYFSSALPQLFVSLFSEVAMPACIETVDPTVASFAERYSLNGVSYDNVRNLFDNKPIYRHLVKTLIRLSKQPLTVESVAIFNIAAKSGELHSCLNAIAPAECADFLFALLDISLIKESSLPSVPPLQFPSYEPFVKDMFDYLSQQAQSHLHPQYDAVVVDVVKRCLEWTNVDRTRGALLRSLASSVMHATQRVRILVFEALSVEEYCKVTEMVLLDKTEKVEEIKLLTVEGAKTLNIMANFAKRVSSALLALSTHYDRLWKEKLSVPSKIKSTLKELLALALATELNDASTIRSTRFLVLLQELWQVKANVRMLFAAYDTSDIVKVLTKLFENEVLILARKASKETTAEGRARCVKLREADSATKIVTTQLGLLLETRSKSINQHGKEERTALKNDAKRLVTRLAEIALQPYSDATPLAQALLSRACLKALLHYIKFVSEALPGSVSQLVFAASKEQALKVPNERKQELEAKSADDAEERRVEQQAEVLLATLRDMHRGLREHGLPSAIWRQRHDAFNGILKDVFNAALKDDQPIFRRVMFTVFKAHHDIFDYLPLASVMELVTLLVRDNDTSLGGDSTAMVDDDEKEEHKPFMAVAEIVAVLKMLAERNVSNYAAKRELPPAVIDFVRSVVKEARDEAGAIEDFNKLESLGSMPFFRMTNAFIHGGIEFLAIAAQTDIPHLFEIFIKTYAIQPATSIPARGHLSRKILNTINDMCTYLNPARINQRRALGDQASKVICDFMIAGMKSCTDPELHNAMHGRTLPTMSSVYFNLLISLTQADFNLIVLATLHESAPDSLLANFLHALMVGTPISRLQAMKFVLSALELATRPDKTNEQEKSKINGSLVPHTLSPKFVKFVDRVLALNLRPAQPHPMDVETANYRIQMLACTYEALRSYPAYIAQRSEVLQGWMAYCVAEAFRTNPSFSLSPLATLAIDYLRNVDLYNDLVARERQHNQDEAARGGSKPNKKKSTLSLAYDKTLPWLPETVAQIASWSNQFREIADAGSKLVGETDRVAFARNARQAGLEVLTKYGPVTMSGVEAPSKGGSIVAKNVWQDQLVELLDAYCVDSDPDIRRVALTQATEEWGGRSAAKALTGADRVGLSSSKKASSGYGARSYITALTRSRGSRGRGRGRGRGARRGGRR